MTSLVIKDAPSVFKLLKGVICVYKPSGVSEGAVKYTLLTKLCKDLNEMESRPPVDYVTIDGDTTKEMRVTVRSSYADNPLVIGPRYQDRDIHCKWALPLGKDTSGVFLLGLNEGVRTMSLIDRAHHLRTFHVEGSFGRATDNFFIDGKVTERSKFKHVSQGWMDKFLSSVQASHQKSMFQLAGLDIKSQDAYEFAVQGMLRAADPHVPMIYGVKCIEFKPPNFTIEVHCTNENEFYLKSLINEIGIKLHTCAVCTGIRCIRHAYFTVHNALLRKHWTLEHVTANIQTNQRILDNNPQLFSGLLKEAKLQDPKEEETSFVC